MSKILSTTLVFPLPFTPTKTASPLSPSGKSIVKSSKPRKFFSSNFLIRILLNFDPDFPSFKN